MKKLILSFIFSIFLILPAFCTDYMPRYADSIRNFGIGIYFGNGKATVYSEPDENSEVLAKMTWDADKVQINDRIADPKNVFAVFVPQNALSGFIALDEQGTEYIKILYDNQKGLSGWIKNSPDEKVFYWRQLFYKYGKTKGLYVFSDVSKEGRYLRLTPDDDGEISHKFVYPRYIRLQLIKGNWALLKVVDYDNEQKVGWFRWRNSDGSLNMYPDFKGN